MNLSFELDLRRICTICFLTAVLLCMPEVMNAQKKLGKIFVKAATVEIDGKQVPDMSLEESVRDIKKRPGKFEVASTEDEADYLIVIKERVSTPQSGNPAAKSILGILYVRKGPEWEPAVPLKSGSNDIFWGIAADKFMKNAAKWVSENRLGQDQKQ